MLVQSELVNILNGVFNQKGRQRKAGSQIMYHCPFCPDKNMVTQKMEIALSGPKIGSYHCWRCNSKGKSFGSLLKKMNASQHYRDAIFKLTGDIRLSRSKEHYEETGVVALPSEFSPMANPKTTPEYKNAMAYLKKRGILREDILRYNIGYCESGPYEHHIIIPSYDAKGTLNFFVGRRYYNTPGAIPHKKPETPMNEIIGFECFINYAEPLNLCEGVFDAIAIRNNAIPLFGKYLSQKLRMAILTNGTKRINMVLDTDAKEDAIKDYIRLKRDFGVDIYMVGLDGKDPSILGFEKVHRCIRDAKPFTEEDLLRHELGL